MLCSQIGHVLLWGSAELGMAAGSAMAIDGIAVLCGMFTLALLIPLITAQVRRLHDVGLSGWWMLAASATVLIGGIIVRIPDFSSPNADQGLLLKNLMLYGGLVCGGIGTLGELFLLYCALRPGEDGENRYGTAPNALPSAPGAYHPSELPSHLKTAIREARMGPEHDYLNEMMEGDG